MSHKTKRASGRAVSRGRRAAAVRGKHNPRTMTAVAIASHSHSARQWGVRLGESGAPRPGMKDVVDWYRAWQGVKPATQAEYARLLWDAQVGWDWAVGKHNPRSIHNPYPYPEYEGPDSASIDGIVVPYQGSWHIYWKDSGTLESIHMSDGLPWSAALAAARAKYSGAGGHRAGKYIEYRRLMGWKVDPGSLGERHKRALAWEVERTGRMNPTPSDYNWNSPEAIRYLDSRTDRQLSKRIDIIRAQMERAYSRRGDSRVDEAVEDLQRQEAAVIQARLRKGNPIGDSEDLKSAASLYTIMDCLNHSGQYHADAFRVGRGGRLFFSLRQHDDGDVTAVVRNYESEQLGPEVVVPPDQLQDVYHYALHHGTMEGWEPGSGGYEPTRNPQVPFRSTEDIKAQLLRAGFGTSGTKFVHWLDNTLRVARGYRGCLIRHDMETDLYSVQSYRAFTINPYDPDIVLGNLVGELNVGQLPEAVESTLHGWRNPAATPYAVQRYSEGSNVWSRLHEFKKVGQAKLSAKADSRVSWGDEPRPSKTRVMHFATGQVYATYYDGKERRSNPADGAADDMFRTFHGTDPTETVEIHEEIVHHGDVAALGDLEELVIVTPRGHKVVLDFTADPPLLCSSSDGKQLLLRGGDMSIDLAAIKMNGSEWVKDVMVLGDVLSVTYRTAKTMDDRKVLSYEHKFTDPEGTKGGDRAYPVLTYDTLNNLLSFAGGTSINLEAGIVG